MVSVICWISGVHNSIVPRPRGPESCILAVDRCLFHSTQFLHIKKYIHIIWLQKTQKVLSWACFTQQPAFFGGERWNANGAKNGHIYANRGLFVIQISMFLHFDTHSPSHWEKGGRKESSPTSKLYHRQGSADVRQPLTNTHTHTCMHASTQPHTHAQTRTHPPTLTHQSMAVSTVPWHSIRALEATEVFLYEKKR